MNTKNSIEKQIYDVKKELIMINNELTDSINSVNSNTEIEEFINNETEYKMRKLLLSIRNDVQRTILNIDKAEYSKIINLSGD